MSSYYQHNKDKVKKSSSERYERLKDDPVFIEQKVVYSKEYRQRAKRTVKGWLTKTYGRMKRDQKNKFNASLLFSKDEFWCWIQQDYKEEFDSLFEVYVESDCNKFLNPSIDRIDDYKGYSFDNMQLMTWYDNNKKGRESEKNKKQCSDMAKKMWSREVQQIDEYGNVIDTYMSTREAERVLGFDSSGIARCCRGECETYKKFTWRYINE